MLLPQLVRGNLTNTISLSSSETQGTDQKHAFLYELSLLFFPCLFRGSCLLITLTVQACRMPFLYLTKLGLGLGTWAAPFQACVAWSQPGCAGHLLLGKSCRLRLSWEHESLSPALLGAVAFGDHGERARLSVRPDTVTHLLCPLGRASDPPWTSIWSSDS